MKKNITKFIEVSYEKLKLLKRTDKGEVWLANARANDELVIIKHVNLTGLPYDVIKNSSFLLPAKVFFCAEDEKDTVVVEEFIHGENMLERLDRKKFLTEVEGRKILIQLCDGLKELHEQNIIHRDIKPSNLILQGERIRLIDFDAARIFKSGKETDTQLLGTRGYAPPEQYGSNQTDPRSDIYSLGVTMKTLLGDNCGRRLKKILDKCTEYDPAHRYQSTGDLKRDILSVVRFSATKKFLATIFFAVFIFITINFTATSDNAVDTKNPPVVTEVPLSIGKLKLGDSLDTVRKIFGAENEIRAAEDLPNTFYHEYKDVVVSVKDNFVTGVATYTDAVKDNRGIRQGDSAQKIFDVYGTECWKIEAEDGETFYEYPFEATDGTLAVMRFAIKNNLVKYMSLRVENKN